MPDLSDAQHEDLVRALSALEWSVTTMRPHCSNALLIWLTEEMEGWRRFIESHRDIDELKSLKAEVFERFHRKYYVLIEPMDLDRKRLAAFETFLSKLSTACPEPI